MFWRRRAVSVCHLGDVMKRHFCAAVILILSLLVLCGSPGAAMAETGTENAKDKVSEKPPADRPQAKKSPRSMRKPVYMPPMRGAPGRRVGGGARGAGGEEMTVFVLAPESVGRTINTQPTLYWYASRPAVSRVEITLNDDASIEPLLEMDIKAPAKAGVHSVRLVDSGVRLAPGAVYEWFVALVVDPANRSRDVLSSGLVEVVEPSPELRRKIASAGKRDLPFIYAGEGLWYDAIDALSTLITENPDDKTLLEWRSDLIRQVGLPEDAL